MNVAATPAKKILVVDDEQLLLQGLVKTLQSEGMHIASAESGREALEKIASCAYHLCFLDIYLPDMNGLEVLKKIKDLSPKTKVIIMTAGILDKTMEECIEKHASMYLTKPFDLLQVKMLIRGLIEEEV